METAIENNSMTMLPLGVITAGNNPRKVFNDDEMKELVASVSANGVIQPIVVRPVGEVFSIVAGERRYRAAREAGLSEIPAVVRELTDEMADQFALIENTVRADMSVTEEAVAAGKILINVNNDREEAAKVLGWPVSKFNRRLALLNLIPEAMDALNNRVIRVGHAELLATIPKDKQGKALDTIITRKLDVAMVKTLLIKASTDFKGAIFDTARCLNCQHNSDHQATLFAETIEAGYCTNSECFAVRTRVRVEEIKDGLKEEFQTIRIIEIGDQGNYVALQKDGSLGVGEEQFNACLSCDKYGASVSAIPGEEGKVEKGLCFNPVCNHKKIAERIKTEKKEQGTTGGEQKSDGKISSKSAKERAAQKDKSAPSGLSQKVKEYRRKKVWDIAAKKELAAQPDKARAFILDLLLTGSGSNVDSHTLCKLFGKVSESEEYPISSQDIGYPEKPYALTPDKQNKLFAAAAVSAVTSIPEKRLKKLLIFLETDLGKHWSVNEEFLALLTKSEIESVCKSIGLDKGFPNFSKVMSDKKDAVIKAIMASGFTFEGAIPDIIRLNAL